MRPVAVISGVPAAPCRGCHAACRRAARHSRRAARRRRATRRPAAPCRGRKREGCRARVSAREQRRVMDERRLLIAAALTLQEERFT